MKSDQIEKQNEMERLRQLAERRLKSAIDADSVETIEDARTLLHELQIHQVELEMQNEELRATRRMLEEERNKYADLFDFAPLGYFTLNHEGVILEVNLNGAVLLGRERRYLISKPFVAYLANESHQVFYETLRAAVQTKESRICEVTLRKQSRLYPSREAESPEATILQLKISPSIEREKESLLRCAATEITTLKKIQSNLEHESQVNKALADLAKNILQLDSISNVADEVLAKALVLTGSMYGFVGYIDEETGALISPTLTKEIWDASRVPKKNFVFGERSGLFGWVLEHKSSLLTNQPDSDPRSSGVPDGHVPIHRYLGVPVMMGDELLGIISVANAVNDYQRRDLEIVEQLADLYALAIYRIRSDALLKKRTEELMRSNTELEEFAYVASHDLQEPLRKIRSFTELLQKQLYTTLDDRSQKYMEYIMDAAQRMQMLINDLLEYSRLVRREMPVKPVDMEDLLSKVLSDLSSSIKESGARITHDPLPLIQANPLQMERLLQNLLVNALKFRSAETPLIHISAYQNSSEIEDEKDEWVFSIKDNGIGIHPDYHERIFQLFQRLHNREEYPGTGMGLAICKKIVERHNGRIWVESEEGKGATFYFTIPAARSQ